MGLFRVLRCGPGGTHGIDNVPETLAEPLSLVPPWRYWRIGEASARHRQTDRSGMCFTPPTSPH